MSFSLHTLFMSIITSFCPCIHQQNLIMRTVDLLEFQVEWSLFSGNNMKTGGKGTTQEYGAGKQFRSSFLNFYARHMYASKSVSKETFVWCVCWECNCLWPSWATIHTHSNIMIKWRQSWKSSKSVFIHLKYGWFKYRILLKRMQFKQLQFQIMNCQVNLGI